MWLAKTMIRENLKTDLLIKLTFITVIASKYLRSY